MCFFLISIISLIQNCDFNLFLKVSLIGFSSIRMLFHIFLGDKDLANRASPRVCNNCFPTPLRFPSCQSIESAK